MAPSRWTKSSISLINNTGVMYFLLPVKGRGKGGGKKGDKDRNGKKRKTSGEDDGPGKKAKITRFLRP